MGNYLHLLVMGLMLNIIYSGLSTITGVSGDLSCAEGLTACADGSGCYAVKDRCDRIPHCTDSSDESDCGLRCSDEEIPCQPDNFCVHLEYKCDGSPDCSDNSDEQNCNGEEFKCELESEFKCETEQMCVAGMHRCDGREHCHDGSDEKNCGGRQGQNGDATNVGGPQSGACKAELQFDCKGDGSECIPRDHVCDEVSDCKGGQDENNATCAGYISGRPQDKPKSRPTSKTLSVCDGGNPCAHNCDPAGLEYICSCKDGYHLAPDKVSCFAAGAEPELIFGNHSQLVTYGLRSQTKTAKDVNAVIQGIAYDHKAGKIFYIDQHRKSINWISKDSGSTSTTLIDKHIHEPVSLAYDWVHGNLYWADVSPHAGTAYSRIEVLSLDKMIRTTILSAPDVRDPRQLTVDPRTGKGYLYWAQIGTSPSICKSDLDGLEPNCFVTTDIQQPSGLTLDYETNTLYWVDKLLGRIISYDLVGLRSHTVTDAIEYPRHPTSLDVYEGMLYWADDKQNAVYRRYVLNTDTSSLPQKVFDNLDSTKDVVVYHPQRFPDGENYCGTNNGGCSHVCLPSPKSKRFTCVCPNVEKGKNGTVTYVLDGSGKRCLEKKVAIPTTATTVAAAVRPGGGATRNNGGLGEKSGGQEQDEKEESGGGSMWIIVGAAIGAIVVLVIVGIVIWRVVVARRANEMQFANPSFETKPLNKSASNGTNGHGVRTSAA